jgi:hypothetical protein
VEANWSEVGSVLISRWRASRGEARRVARRLTKLGHYREVRRLANLPEYRNLPECEKLVKEVADELKVKNPLAFRLKAQSVGKIGSKAGVIAAKWAISSRLKSSGASAVPATGG